MMESKYKSYEELPLFLNMKRGPHGNAKRFRGERRNSGMSEPCRRRQGEGYGACDDEVAKVLGVSPSSGYELMHESGFPVLKVGSRMVVPKEKFQEWVEHHTAGGDNQ